MIYPPALRNIWKFKRAFVLIIFTVLLVNSLSLVLDRVINKNRGDFKESKDEQNFEVEKTKVSPKNNLDEISREEWLREEETRRALLESLLIRNR